MPESPTRPRVRLATINMDCQDSGAMADFYGKFLGWEITWQDGDFVLMRDPAGGTGVSFQAYPDYVPPTWPEEARAQSKMIHLDINVEDLEAAAAFALACGAGLAEYQGRDDLRVMLDPAGHPFCLFLT